MRERELYFWRHSGISPIQLATAKSNQLLQLTRAHIFPLCQDGPFPGQEEKGGEVRAVRGPAGDAEPQQQGLRLHHVAPQQ